jgi:hypothetical protein
MDPTIWGPKLWFFIHTIALNFPENPTFEQKKSYESFFENLKYIIPCDKCRLHYTQRQQVNPVSKYLTDPNALFKYTIDLHNEVNKSLGKRIYSYQEVSNLYKNHYNNPYKFDTFKKKIFNTKNLVIVIVLIMLLLLIRHYKKKYLFRIIKT